MDSFGIVEKEELQGKSKDFLSNRLDYYTIKYNQSLKDYGQDSDPTQVYANNIRLLKEALGNAESKTQNKGNSNPLPQSRSR